MTELQLKILQYMQSCTSIETICNNLKISEKQLYYYLSLMKNLGVLFDFEYGCDGKKFLKFANSGSITNTSPQLIINNNNSKFIKTIAIADLHVGNNQSCLKKLDYLFDYAVKNNINIILILGDVLNGQYQKSSENLNNEEQINYFIDNYPYDKSINTIGIIGNHENDSFINSSHIDPTCLINTKRPDIHLINRISADLRIKDRQSNNIVSTPIRLMHTSKPNSDSFPILIAGHHHRYSVFNSENGHFIIDVPAFYLSSNPMQKCAHVFKYPEFLEIYFYINRTDMSIPKFDIDHLAFMSDDNIPTCLSSASYAVRTKKKKN